MNQRKKDSKTVEKQIRPKNEDSTLEALVAPRIKELVLKTDGDENSCLYALVIDTIERPLIQFILKQAKGNQTKAAKILGINRNTLRAKIQRHGIDIKMAKRVDKDI